MDPRAIVEYRDKRIVMLGTSTDTKGGVSSVIKMYRKGGLLDRWPIIYLATHCDGNYWVKIYTAIKSLTCYALLLLRGKVACVHAHTASRSSFWRKSIFMLLGFIGRTPVIFHLHGAEFDAFYFKECGKLLRLYIRFILKHCAHIVVLSSQWKGTMSRITENKSISVIHNPIDVAAENLPTDLMVRDATSLLFLGKLGKRKGIYDLLKVVAALYPKFPTIKLLCGGDGDLEGVARYATELGIEDYVEVLGWVSGGEKDRLLNTCAVYVLPSYAEGLPMGLLEAMASGMPVVSTSVGGIPDAIDDQSNGFMVAPGDIEAIQDAIARLLSDQQLRVRMGKAAREKVSQVFSLDKILAEVESIYATLGVQTVDKAGVVQP